MDPVHKLRASMPIIVHVSESCEFATEDTRLTTACMYHSHPLPLPSQVHKVSGASRVLRHWVLRMHCQ